MFHAWFTCGSSTVQVRLRCCSSVVQEFYHRWGAAAWLTTRSARVPRVRFRCGSGVVQVWLKYGSSVVEAWFKRGSSMAPSGGPDPPRIHISLPRSCAKRGAARHLAAPRGNSGHEAPTGLGKSCCTALRENRTARHDAAPREPNGRHFGMEFAYHAGKRIVQRARARRQPNPRKWTAECRCSAMLTRCALARRHFQRGGPFLSRTWR